MNPNDKAAEDKFKEINEANEVLSDPEKRKKYDEMRQYYLRYGQWSGTVEQEARAATSGYESGGGSNYQYHTVNEEDLEDLFGGQSPFSDFFETYFHSGSGRTSSTTTNGRGRQRTSPGQDVKSAIDVTLAEAYQGVTRTFELADPDGNTRRLEVKIPAGVDEGSRIRITGQGIRGTAERGDLYLLVHLEPDSRFIRKDMTLRTKVDIPLTAAMLSGEVRVPTPDGRHLLPRIPARTDNGRSFRLRGQGMSERVGQKDTRGDLYVEVKIVLPTHLTVEQRRLFEAFALSIGYKETQTSAETGGNYAWEYIRITLQNSRITSYYSEQETSEYSRLEMQAIRFLTDAGVISGINVAGEGHRYSDDDIALLRRVRRMSHDLGINLEGIEVILRLLSRIEALQYEQRQYKETKE